MAKKKPKALTENERVGLLFNNIATKHGGLTTLDLETNCAGFTIPYYSERYIRGSNVYITGQVEMYVGGQGSGKTSYGFHVANRFLDAGGYFFLIETENKLSPVSLKANLGPERFSSGRVQLIPTGSVDMEIDGDAASAHLQSWQTALSSVIKTIRQQNLEHLPVYILVDSMLGAAGKESRKEYDEDGQSQGRSTSDMARAASITRFLSNLVVDLRGTNILVGFTNHGKTKIQMGGMPMGGDDRSVPGGAAILFHCSLVLWFERGAKVKSAETAGRVARIGCFKNSFGGEERKLGVEFRYDHIRDDDGVVITDATDEYTRIVCWDWHGATGHLLKNFCAKENFDEYLSSAKARGLIDLHNKGGKFSSELLEVEGVTAAELGIVFETRPDVEKTIRAFPKLGVCQYLVIEYDNSEG